MAWSAGVARTTASGSTRAMAAAAYAIAGAVFLPSGSRRMFRFGMPRSRWERCGASLTPATTQTRSGGTTGKRRRRVSRIIGPPPVRSRNCFDRRARLSGQNRVPDPPAITTA